MTYFDIDGARKAGASDDDIVDFLASRASFDAVAARKAGASTGDILGFLAGRADPASDGRADAYSDPRSTLYAKAGPELSLTPTGSTPTSVNSAPVVTPGVETNFDSVLKGRTPEVGGNFDPTLDKKFVAEFRSTLAALPVENRLAALTQYAKNDKTAYGRAARVLLAEEQYKNKRVTDDARDIASKLNAGPQLPAQGGPGGVGGNFPEATPGLVDSRTSKEVAETNDTALGVTKALELAKEDNKKFVPPSPERNKAQKLLDVTLGGTDTSVGGFALETAGDAMRGLVQGTLDFSSAAWGALYAAASSVGLEDTKLGQTAKYAAQAGQESIKGWANPNDPDGLAQGVARSITGSLISAGLTGNYGNAALAVMSAVSAGNAYTEARLAGKGNEDAMERATVNFFAEFVGEKIALPQVQKLFLSAAKKASLGEVVQLTGELMAKDMLGEQATTAVESFYDKFGSGGMQPGMTWADYGEAALQTAKATFMQGLVMGGGAMGVRGVAKAMTSPERAVSNVIEENVANTTSVGVQEQVVQSMKAVDTFVTAKQVELGKATNVDEAVAAAESLLELPTREGVRNNLLSSVSESLTPMPSGETMLAGVNQVLETANVGELSSLPGVASQAAADGGVVPTGGVGLGTGDVAAGAQVAGLGTAVAPTGSAQQLGTGATAPLKTWTGRAGDGYLTREAATQALPSRQKVYKNLEWTVAQREDGRFQLEGRAPVAATAAQPTAALPTATVATTSAWRTPGATTIAPEASSAMKLAQLAPTPITAATLPQGGQRAAATYALRAVERARAAQYGETVKLEIADPTTSEGVAVAAAMATAYKQPVMFVREANGVSLKFNGATVGGTILLDANSAESPVWAVVKHEIDHSMPEDIRKPLVEAVWALSTPEQRAAFAKDYRYTAAEAPEELAMIMNEKFAGTASFWSDVRAKVGDDTVFGKIATRVIDVIDKTIQRFAGVESMAKYTTDLAKVREAIVAATVTDMKQRMATGNVGTAPVGVQFSNRQTDDGATEGPATQADFAPDKLPSVMRKGRWSIFTAHDPNATKAPPEANAAAQAKLLADLDAIGAEYMPAVGKYGDVQDSLIVTNIDQEDAVELGKKYGQESVLTRKGFLYPDGRRVTPATGEVTIFDTEPEDYYTKIKVGGKDVYFSMGIDFEGAEGKFSNKPMEDETPARYPTGRKFSGDRTSGEMYSTMDAARADPGYLAKLGPLISSYTEITGANNDETIELNIEFFKRNLLWLHDHAMQVSPQAYEMATRWYAGGNRIAKEWAAAWGVEPRTVAGMMAVTSPSTEWFVNLQIAKHIGEFLTQKPFTWTPEMQAEMSAQRADPKAKPAFIAHIDALAGKPSGDITTPAQKAIWYDIYDSAHHDGTYHEVTPDGEFLGLAMTKGRNSRPATGIRQAVLNIQKAISIFENQSKENLSNMLGNGLKVRNFYNNLANPDSANPYITIDTHAVAAAHLLGLSAQSPEATSNFGSPSSSSTGLSGTYPLYHEAYSRAAAERSVRGREMQSITWEAGRVMFEKKRSNGATIRGVWQRVREGELNEQQARVEIQRITGGVSEPDWFGRDNRQLAAARVPGDAGELDGGRVPGAGVRGPRPGAEGGNPAVSYSNRLGVPIPAGAGQAAEGEFIGVHYGRAAGLTKLAGTSNGTGINGAERERLSQPGVDPRIKKRVYFYLASAEGVLPSPEAGLGPHIYHARLGNIADPLKPEHLARIEAERKAPGANAMESAVLDAGFSGFANREQGTVVVLNRDVPVRYDGTTEGRTFTERKVERVLAPNVGRKEGEYLVKKLTNEEMLAFSRQRAAITQAAPSVKMQFGELRVKADEAGALDGVVKFSNTKAEYAAVEAKYKGSPQWMKAPNGEPTKLTERQWVQVRTPAFKEWFGDWEKFAAMPGGVWNDGKREVSKVVDENGEPLVVYHGSDKGGFMSFDTPGGKSRGDLGIFTSDNYDMADSYVRKNRTRRVEAGDENDPGSQPGIYGLFVNLREPYEEDFEGATWSGSRDHQWVVEVDGELRDQNGVMYFDSADDAAKFAGTLPEAEGDPYDYVHGAEDKYESTDDVVRAAWSMKMDGAIIRNVIDDGGGPSRYNMEPSDVFVLRQSYQLKSADWNTGEFGRDTDDLRFSNQAPFYSALSRELEKANTKAALGEGWRLQIKGLLNKGAIKQDEVTWTGIEEWLGLQSGKVTKDQVLAYLNGNGVRVEEVVLGRTADERVPSRRTLLSRAYHAAVDRAQEAGGALNPEWIERQPSESRTPEEQAVLDTWNAVNEHPEEPIDYGPVDDAKFAKYTLPGGENYREVLLTLPGKSKPTISFEDWLRSIGFDHSKMSDRALDDARSNYTADSKNFEGGNVYRSGHWDQPNVLAHLRVNDRVDADGKRVLFVEEIQSDFGQDAKRYGFKSPPGTIAKLKADLAKAEMAKRDAATEMGVVEDLITKPLYLNGTKEAKARIDRRLTETRDAYYGVAMPGVMRARAALEDAQLRDNKAVPAAPFVDKTDKWLTLALKRVITMAVDGGYDKVAFVNGEQSADRYDLSKQIRQIDAAKMNGDYFMIVATGNSGKTVIEKAVAKDALPDVVGKELASKIISDGGGTYSGLDLKVGGEGMKTFYDHIIPNATKALLKKLGGGQMASVKFREDRGFEDSYQRSKGMVIPPITQPGFTLTPEMREKAEAGLPLFSNTPEFKAWSGGAPLVRLGEKAEFRSGQPVVVEALHGPTNADVTQFRRERANAESDWGAGFYASNAPDDVAANYANNEGPDLTMKVERLAEQLEQDGLDMDVAREKARATLSESAPNTMKLYVSFKNPAVLGGKGETFLDLHEEYDEENDEYGEPTGSLVALAEALDNSDGLFIDQSEIEDLKGKLYEAAEGDGVSLSAVYAIFKNNALDVYDEGGSQAGQELLRQALAAVGFDGVIDTTVGSKFKMKGTGANTVHFIAFEPTQIKSATGNRGTFDPTNPDIRYSNLPIETRTQRYRRNMQDYFLRIKTLQDTLGNVTETTDVYGAEERSHGRIETQLRDLAKQGIEPITKQLAEAGLEFDELALYAYAKFAPARNAMIAGRNAALQDGGSGMTDQEAQDILDKFADEGLADKLEPIRQNLLGIVDATRRVLLDDGLITQAQYDSMVAEGDYVPLRGFEKVDEDNKPMKPALGRGFDVRGKETMRALGRTSRAGDIIENIIYDYERAVVRGERNQVAQRFLALVQANPDPDLWEIDAIRTQRSFRPDMNMVITSSMLDDGRDTLSVKVAGKEVFIKIKDELTLRAMEKLFKEETSGLERVLVNTLGHYTNLLRNTLTRYNPVFGAINAVRDYGQAAVIIQADLGAKGTAVFAKNYAGALATSFANEVDRLDLANRDWARWETEFKAAGGSTGGFHMRDLDTLRSDLRDALLAAGAEPRTKMERLKVSTPYKGAMKFLHAMEIIGSATENAARLAAYRTAREMGKTPAQAASIAKNLTTNFNRKGEWGTALNSLFMFYNAAIQGTATLGRALKSPTVRASMAGLTGLSAALAVMAVAVGGDDDDGQAMWDKIPDSEKARNLILMLPPGLDIEGAETVGLKGRYIKLPIQYGLTWFTTLGYNLTDVARWAADENRGVNPLKAGIRQLTATMTSVNPFGGEIDFNDWTTVAMAGLPTAADSVIQIGAGVSAFGSRLVPEKFNPNLPDSENANLRQYGGRAHRIARWMNAAMGGNEGKAAKVAGVDVSIAPGTIEGVVGQLTGGLGRFLWDVGVNLPTKLNNASAETVAKDYPLARNFYGAVDAGVEAGLFYDRRKQATTTLAEYKKQLELGIDVTLSDKEEKLAAMGEVAKDFTEAMTGLKKAEIAVVRDETMTKTERDARLAEIKAQRNSLYRTFNKVYVDVTQGKTK